MRRARWILLAATILTVLGALVVGEGVARTIVSTRIAESGPSDVQIAPAGLVLWGLLTGAMPVTVTVEAATLTTAIDDALTRSAGVEVHDVRVDDRIYVELLRATPVGDVVITAALEPEVLDGALATQLVSVTANGMELPPAALEEATLTPGADLIDAECLVLHDAHVDNGSLVLTADLLRGC